MSAQQPLAASLLESGLRQAALLLHAMQHDDRQWVLGKLPSKERSAIAPMLAELTSLGIPRDRDILQQAIAQSNAATAPIQDASAQQSAQAQLENSSDAMLRTLDCIKVSDGSLPWSRLVALLKDEPAGLIAQLLRIHDWSWREQALRALSPRKRARVMELCEQSPPAQKGSKESQSATDLRVAILQITSKQVFQAIGEPPEARASLEHNSSKQTIWFKRQWRSARRILPLST